MAYIGNQVSSSPFITDTYTGNGAQTAFLNMTFAPAAASSIAVYVNGLYQRPVTAYTVSGTTLNFVSAPAVAATIVVLHLGIGQTTTTTVADGSISNVKIQATGTANSSTYLRGDNQWAVLNLNSISGDLTVTGNVTVNSSGYLQLPSGNNSTKPLTGANGAIRFSTSNTRVEVLISNIWYPIAGLTPSITAVTGNIYTTAATTLNVTVSSATATDTLEVYEGANLVSSINSTSASLTNGNGYMTFVMPSAVFNKSSGTNLLLYLKNSSGLSTTTQTKTVEVARSCKQLLDFGLVTTSGTYTISNYGTITPESHYCLQDASYNGGGWTLLLTMTDGNTNFAGTNNPFVDPGSVGSPSVSSIYTRNRANTFTPAVNDQFLIRRGSNSDWVRFVISSGWVAGSSWETLNGGHNDFANGQTYNAAGSALTNFTNFNCCTKGGNCGSGGGDGCGFGTFDSWCDNSTSGGGTAYGFGFNGASNGGSPACWGVQSTFITDTMTFYFRKDGTQ